MSASDVIGILTLSRHGDRSGFYQSPTSYTASLTNLTVLGYLQEYQNGADLRSLYLADGSPTQIAGINATKAENPQIAVYADAGGEGGVIMESAAAALQGLYPSFNDSLVLANGSTVSWNRVQLIPIESVEVADSFHLEGYTGCTAFTNRLNSWYNSSDFLGQAQVASAFYSSIAPLLGGRPANLVNAWNVFDYLNVQSIHNATFAQALPPNALEQAKYWADYHEAGSFSDPDLSNVGNIAGQAIYPLIVNSLSQIANTSNPLKVVNIFSAYKPFLPLLNILQIGSPSNVFPTGKVVDYASTAIFEVRADQSVRFLYRNGTTGTFQPWPILNTGSPDASVPLRALASALAPYSLNSDADWCNKCAATAPLHGCDVLAALNGTGGAPVRYAPITSTKGPHRVSPVVAGVIGSMVTLALCTALFIAAVLVASHPRHQKGGGRRTSGAEGSPISRPARWLEQRREQGLAQREDGVARLPSEEGGDSTRYELGDTGRHSRATGASISTAGDS